MNPRLARDLAHLAHVEASRGDPRVAAYASRMANIGDAPKTEPKSASAQIDALKSITSDPTLGPILSDPSKLVTETLKSAAETAAGVGIDALKSTGESLAPIVADAIGMSMADLSESIPMVGAAFAVVFKIVDNLLNASEFNRAQDNAVCTSLQGFFKPVGTGSILGGGSVMPADIFAPVHRMIDAYSGDFLKYAKEAEESQYSGIGLDLDRKANPMTSGPVLGCSRYASTLGQALMLLTEGAQVDVKDVDFRWIRAVMGKYPGWKPRPYVRLFSGGVKSGKENADNVNPYPTDGRSWSKMAAEVVAVTDDPFRLLVTSVTSPKIGIDPARRAQLQKIRRAISESYRPGAYGVTSDGGAAMWLVYLDILRDLVKKGAIDAGYISYVLVYRQYAYLHMIPPFGHALFGFNPMYLSPTQQGLHTCAAQATDQILGVVKQWDDAAAPRYAQGHAKIDDVKRQAQDIGRRAGHRASGVDAIADGIRSLFGGT